MNWGNIRGTFYTYGGLFKNRAQRFELVPVCEKFELSPFEIKIRTNAFELITVPYSSCAEMEQEDLPTLHKYNAVHWYCKSCEELLKSTSLVELLTSLTSRLNDIQDENLQDQMRFDTLQTNIDELKTSVEKLHSKKSYAETVSPAESRPPLQTKTTDKQPGHDLNKTLIVTNTSNFSNSVAIKKEFAKIFPLKRLIYAFTTVRVNIHLEVLTGTEATEVIEKWEPTFLGNQSKIRRANEIEKH